MTLLSPPPSAVLADSSQVRTDPFPQLIGGSCPRCETAAFPCPEICPQCWGPVDSLPLSNVGELYSYSTIHVGSERPTPYTVGYVDLPEGARVFAHIAESPDRLVPDMPVQIRIEPGTQCYQISWTAREADNA